MKKLIFLFAAFFYLCPIVSAAPQIAEIDRVRIAEAYRVGEKVQDKLWMDWSKAPFGILFITDDNEFLIRHPKPNDEFTSIGYDKMLKSEVFVRPRKFQKNFLATFPAFSATPVIVVGKAENTSEKASTRWMFVVLHEHFHQLQYSQPTYFNDVNALDLSGGDTTGMWQINYPFPYKDAATGAKFRELSGLLLAVYEARNSRTFGEKLRTYLSARREFAASLKPADLRYFSFQLWQEGVARYTQYRIAELAAKRVKPSKRFAKLPDATSFATEADRLLKATLADLKAIDLADSQRVVFYPFGAVEALLLDEVDAKWRDKYFTDKFALEKLYGNR